MEDLIKRLEVDLQDINQRKAQLSYDDWRWSRITRISWTLRDLITQIESYVEQEKKR